MKLLNDCFGHAAGWRAIISVCIWVWPGRGNSEGSFGPQRGFEGLEKFLVVLSFWAWLTLCDIPEGMGAPTGHSPSCPTGRERREAPSHLWLHVPVPPLPPPLPPPPLWSPPLLGRIEKKWHFSVSHLVSHQAGLRVGNREGQREPGGCLCVSVCSLASTMPPLPNRTGIYLSDRYQGSLFWGIKQEKTSSVPDGV